MARCKKIGGKYVIAELGTQNVQGLYHILSTLAVMNLENLPLFFTKDHVHIECMDRCRIYVVRVKFRPLCGDTDISISGAPSKEDIILDDVDATINENSVSDEPAQKKRRSYSKKRDRVVYSIDSDKHAIPSSELDYYTVHREVKVFVDASTLQKNMTFAANADIVRISVLSESEECDPCALRIDYKNGNIDGNVEMRLLDCDTDEITIPEQNVTHRVTLPANEMKNLFRQLNASAGSSTGQISVRITSADKTGVRRLIIAMTQLDSTVEVAFAPGVSKDYKFWHNETDVRARESLSSMYSLQPLINISKMSASSMFMEIGFIYMGDEDDSCLLQVKYVISDLGVVEMFVAPKITS